MKKRTIRRVLVAIVALFFAGIATTSVRALSHPLTPQTIQTPTGKIEYYRFGQGTPLVLITGYFADVKSWSGSFLKALAAKHDVIIFDNRNVGGSVNTSHLYKAKDLAEDTKYLLDSLHLSHVNLLGISMGGMIAQQFAITYPKTVDHLILINTFIAGRQPTYPSREVQADLYSYPKGKLKQYWMALRILFPKDARYKMFIVFLRDRFKSSTAEAPISPAVIEQQRQLVLAWIKDKSALEKIRQLKIPVLILSGGEDAVIPYSNTDVLHREIPHSTLVRWKKGGHVMIFQYPESIAEVINQWLLTH